MRRLLVVVIGLVAVVFAGACGSDEALPEAKPSFVPDDVVPPTVAGDLTVHEFEPARGTFARAGETSLVADGKVWALRKGETLVGTLQVSTLKPDVSVDNREDRAAILGGVMTGMAYETIDVGDVDVYASTVSDKSVYLWFGPDFFQVLQVKGTKADPDTVAADLIDFQLATGKIGRRAR